MREPWPSGALPAGRRADGRESLGGPEPAGAAGAGGPGAAGAGARAAAHVHAGGRLQRGAPAPPALPPHSRVPGRCVFLPALSPAVPRGPGAPRCSQRAALTLTLPCLPQEYVYEGADGQTEVMPVRASSPFPRPRPPSPRLPRGAASCSPFSVQLWTPPTPPQDDNDIYIDSVMCLMYETTPIPEAKLPPVYVRKERRRHRTDPSGVCPALRAPGGGAEAGEGRPCQGLAGAGLLPGWRGWGAGWRGAERPPVQPQAGRRSSGTGRRWCRRAPSSTAPRRAC